MSLKDGDLLASGSQGTPAGRASDTITMSVELVICCINQPLRKIVLSLVSRGHLKEYIT